MGIYSFQQINKFLNSREAFLYPGIRFVESGGQLLEWMKEIGK
jgi:hypothetical protein